MRLHGGWTWGCLPLGLTCLAVHLRCFLPCLALCAEYLPPPPPPPQHRGVLGGMQRVPSHVQDAAVFPQPTSKLHGCSNLCVDSGAVEGFVLMAVCVCVCLCGANQDKGICLTSATFKLHPTTAEKLQRQAVGLRTCCVAEASANWLVLSLHNCFELCVNCA